MENNTIKISEGEFKKEITKAFKIITDYIKNFPNKMKGETFVNDTVIKFLQNLLLICDYKYNSKTKNTAGISKKLEENYEKLYNFKESLEKKISKNINKEEKIEFYKFDNLLEILPYFKEVLLSEKDNNKILESLEIFDIAEIEKDTHSNNEDKYVKNLYFVRRKDSVPMLRSPIQPYEKVENEKLLKLTIDTIRNVISDSIKELLENTKKTPQQNTGDSSPNQSNKLHKNTAGITQKKSKNFWQKIIKTAKEIKKKLGCCSDNNYIAM